MGSLILCSHCHRHAKRQERACPFCGNGLGSSPSSRAGLAAAFVVGLGMSFAGCGDEVETSDDDDGSTNVGGMLAAYGPAPGGWGGNGDAGSPAPAYGPAPGGFGGTGGDGGTGGNGGNGGTGG